MLSGVLHHCSLSHFATARDLKRALSQLIGVNLSRLCILTERNCPCEDETSLLTLADWCALWDLLDPQVLEPCHHHRDSFILLPNVSQTASRLHQLRHRLNQLRHHHRI